MFSFISQKEKWPKFVQISNKMIFCCKSWNQDVLAKVMVLGKGSQIFGFGLVFSHICFITAWKYICVPDAITHTYNGFDQCPTGVWYKQFFCFVSQTITVVLYFIAIFRGPVTYFCSQSIKAIIVFVWKLVRYSTAQEILSCLK